MPSSATESHERSGMSWITVRDDCIAEHSKKSLGYVKRHGGCQAVRNAAQRGRQQQSAAKIRGGQLSLVKFLERHGALDVPLNARSSMESRRERQDDTKFQKQHKMPKIPQNLESA